MAAPAPFSDDELSGGAVQALLEGVEFHFLPQRVERRLVMAFIERGGWYGADPFLVWLRQKLDSGPWKDGQRQFSGVLSNFPIELFSVGPKSANASFNVCSGSSTPRPPRTTRW